MQGNVSGPISLHGIKQSAILTHKNGSDEATMSTGVGVADEEN